MTSVRTCYCKQEENVSRKKDGEISDRNPPTAISRRLLTKNKVCKSNKETPKREESVEKMSKNRSVEVQSDPVLSPETSTALENAEKIINNAKIQLLEVCAMSSLDSVRRNRNTYSDPPLDDETEELLYIRELVASKFYEASTSRSEANDKTSTYLDGRSPQVTVHRIDLSAPKFRMSRRGRADYRSLEYGGDRPNERASPAGSPSGDSSSSSKNSNDEDENEATTRGDRARNLLGRTSTATERELVRARENTCEIQIGPSVHIVDRELTRQDLEDVHISPESSCCRPNTATYILRHFNAENPVTSADNEPRKISGAPKKTLRIRLDSSRREGPIAAEAVTRATSVYETTNVSEKSIGDIKDSEQDNSRIESITSQVQNCIDRKETNTKDMKIPECSENATNQEAINSIAIENSGMKKDNGKLQDKLKKQSNVKITFRNDMNHAEGGRIFNKDSDIDRQVHLRNEESTVDEIQDKNPSDRSKSDNDTLRKTSFPRRGDIASQTYQTTESSRLYQTQIDERFSNTFDSHNGQDELYDNTDKDVRHRSFVSSCMDDFRTKDNLNEVDLYRPCLNDLDTILLSNDRKIERVVRVTENFAESLSKLEVATYRDKGKQTPQYVNHKELCHDSSADKDGKLMLNEPTRSLTFETELKNTDLTISRVPSEMRATNTNAQGMSTDTLEKSSSFTKESGSCSKYSKNSVESSVFPASDTSYSSEISRDKVQRPRAKAHLSESSIYKSDVTTFSNIVPALSSTRTDTQIYGEKHITQDNRQADAGRYVTSVNRLSKREIARSQREYSGKVFAQTPRKDTSEAADRFIAYILQDEKQSIEKKITDALKESTIAPVAVQKLLDNLNNVESNRKARETETLDILKNILMNVQNQTDPETKESVLFAARSDSIQHSKNNRQTESVDIAKIDADKSQTNEGVEDNGKTFPENVVNSSNRANASEESIPQTQVKDDANDIVQIAKKSYNFEKPDKPPSDFSACRETREDVVSLSSTALLESVQSSKNNSKGISYSEAESLKQISDIRSDDDILIHKSPQNPSTRTVSAKFNEECTMEADDPIAAIAESAEYQEDDVNNEKREDEASNVRDNNVPHTQEAIKEITIEEAHDDIASVNQNLQVLPAKIPELRDEQIHLNAKSVCEILEKEDVNLVHSSTKVDIDSQHSVVQEKIDLVANSYSADYLRDHTLSSSTKNSKLSLKEVASRIEPSIIAEENDLIKNTKHDETRGKSMMIMVVDNHRNGIEDSGFLKNAKINKKGQMNDLQKYNIDILSSSNSSVNSALLDYDNRSTNDVFSANAKNVETSSETSHSEGELYMPSSCSYSLGEVRVLKKCEMLSDNSIDRDSSTTILVTRSMLTSLNDSPASLLAS